MDSDLKSPRGRSATIKFIFTAVVADGSANGKLITPAESWIDNTLRQFSDSSLDPRNLHINWEAVVRRHLEGLRRLTAPPFQSYAERTGALAMYFVEGNEEWGKRGDAWVSTSVPLGFSRPVSQSPAVLDQVAAKSPAAVRDRLGCLAYAFQQDLEV